MCNAACLLRWSTGSGLVNSDSGSGWPTTGSLSARICACAAPGIATATAAASSMNLVFIGGPSPDPVWPFLADSCSASLQPGFDQPVVEQPHGTLLEVDRAAHEPVAVGARHLEPVEQLGQPGVVVPLE